MVERQASLQKHEDPAFNCAVIESARSERMIGRVRVFEAADAALRLSSFSNLFAELQGSSLRQHMPRASAVPFTTITMNKRYAARLHRDSRNDGPSIGNAVGKFSGGKLLYWRRFLLRNVRGSAGGSCKQEATSFHAESADHRDNVRQCAR